jgi:hypothetical protein
MLKITIEFVGGPNDGKILHGRVGKTSDAERYYLLTNHGAVGQRFKVASLYAVKTLVREKLKVEKRHHFQRHYYVVTNRIDNSKRIWVRAEYAPESVKSA